MSKELFSRLSVDDCCRCFFSKDYFIKYYLFYTCPKVLAFIRRIRFVKSTFWWSSWDFYRFYLHVDFEVILFSNFNFFGSEKKVFLPRVPVGDRNGRFFWNSPRAVLDSLWQQFFASARSWPFFSTVSVGACHSDWPLVRALFFHFSFFPGSPCIRFLTEKFYFLYKVKQGQP